MWDWLWSGPEKREGRMFESFKSFVSDFVAGDKHPSQFGDDDYRLAAAALLVHAAAIDGEMLPSERDKLHAVLKSRFTLDDAATAALIDAGITADRNAVDLYHFTSLINRALDEDGRLRMVEMMWEIIYADGRVTEFEENVIWRASDLLGISSRTRIEIRHRVAARQSGRADGA